MYPSDVCVLFPAVIKTCGHMTTANPTSAVRCLLPVNLLRAHRSASEASLVGPDGCGKAAAQGSTPSSSASRWRQVYVGAKEQQRQSRTSSAEEQQWMQVYPPDDGIRVENPPEGEKRFHIHGPEVSRPSDIPAPKGPSDSGRGGSWGPWSKLSVRGGGGGEEGREAAQQENRSLWVWAERGGAPIGRLLSLLSLQVANCGKREREEALPLTFARREGGSEKELSGRDVPCKSRVPLLALIPHAPAAT